MNKKIPVVKTAIAEPLVDLCDLEFKATLSFEDVGAALRDGFMAMASAAGLVVMRQMMEAEFEQRLGPKHAKLLERDRVAYRHGTTKGSVVLGDRKLSVERPRARTIDGDELELDTWKAFSAEELFDQLVVERMIAGVATRRHRDIAVPLASDIDSEAMSFSKSAISKRFIKATESAMAELMARDLSELEVGVLMIDGKVIASQSCVIALVICTDGTKLPVGLWLGDTENKVVVKDLLADLVSRGLPYEDGILCVIDGGKALHRGITDVFGDKAVIQRCTLHKRRNVKGYLSKELGATIDKRLALAFSQPDAAKGKKAVESIAAEIEGHHPDAAGSLREGLDEMFTLRTLGMTGTLARTLSTTNTIESMMSIVERTTHRVTNWKDGTMKKRWIAAGMLEAERSFNRMHGFKQLPKLKELLRKRTSPTSKTSTVYHQAA